MVLDSAHKISWFLKAMRFLLPLFLIFSFAYKAVSFDLDAEAENALQNLPSNSTLRGTVVLDEELLKRVDELINNADLHLDQATFCGSGGFNDIYGNCIYATDSYYQDYRNAPKRSYTNQCTSSQWTAPIVRDVAGKIGCSLAATLCSPGGLVVCRKICRELYKVAVKNFCNGNVNQLFNTNFRTCGTYWCCNWLTTKPCWDESVCDVLQMHKNSMPCTSNSYYSWYLTTSTEVKQAHFSSTLLLSSLILLYFILFTAWWCARA